MNLRPLPLPKCFLDEREVARCRELPLARFMSAYMEHTEHPVYYAQVIDVFKQYLLFLDEENEGLARRKTSKSDLESLLINALDISCVGGVIQKYRFKPHATLLQESTFGGTKVARYN